MTIVDLNNDELRLIHEHRAMEAVQEKPNPTPKDDTQHELLVKTKFYSLEDAQALLDGFEKMHKLRRSKKPTFLFVQLADNNKFMVSFTGSQVHIECDTLERAVALGYGAAIQKRCSDSEVLGEPDAPKA